ncbi:MAG: sugar transferase [Pyrinomonadaceae bacterium]
MSVEFQEKTLPHCITATPKTSVFVSRTAECVLAFLGLTLLSPLFLIFAAIIKITSPGRIFFRQERVGRGGKVFILYKFRSMIDSKNGLLVTAEGDFRITLFGRLMRKTKLDELPELYNVLRGDMALVGPRPEVVDFVDLANPLWRDVLTIRPGITDPVTIQFRNEEGLLAGVEDKRKFYLEVIQPYKLEGYKRYLRTKGLKNDLKIVAKTLKVVVFPSTSPPLMIDGISHSQQQPLNVISQTSTLVDTP